MTQSNCPKGKALVTLRDAASYIMALPGKTRQSDEWQAAIEALLMAADDRGPLMHARIGMLRALNRNVERVFNPDRKDTHWGKRKLKRGRVSTQTRHEKPGWRPGGSRVFASK